MKFNYRDKIIAGVLLAIIILLVGFFVPVKNQIKQNKKDKATLAERQETKAEYEKLIAQIPSLQESIRSVYSEASEVTKIFVPVADIDDQIKLDKYMQKYADECKLKVKNLEVRESSIAPINYYYQQTNDKFGALRGEADINGTFQQAYDAAVAGEVAVAQRAQENVIISQYAIKVNGTKANVWKYLEEIKKNDKALVINSVNLSDYTFGKDAAKQAGVELPDAPDGAEVTVQAGENQIKNTSDAQIVVTLYSVIEMEEPDVELK